MANYPVRVLWNYNDWGQWASLNGNSQRYEFLPKFAEDTNQNKLVDVMASPKVGFYSNWYFDYLDIDTVTPRDGVTAPSTTDPLGKIPESELYYQFNYGYAEAFPIDSLYIVGLEDADLRIRYRDTTWHTLTVADLKFGDLSLRRSRHWSGFISHKFLVFNRTINAQYWEFRFNKVGATPLTGFISFIVGGMHYEYEATLGAGFGVDRYAAGQSQGGHWTAADVNKPVFRSGNFVFPLSPFADLLETDHMLYNRMHGYPVVVQYFSGGDAASNDYHCLYGVPASGSSSRPADALLKEEISFQVNETTLARQFTTFKQASVSE